MTSRKKDITLQIYNDNKIKRIKQFYYINDIKIALKKFNIDNKGKKKELENKLYSYFDHLNTYNKHLSKIVLLQRCIQKYVNKIKIKNQGIGILDKSKCKNQEDFYTLDSVYEIENKYFFSYEKDGHIYFFDIRSFKQLLNNDGLNPYNREKIPNHALYSYNNRLIYCKKYNIILENIEGPKLSKEQLFNNNVLNVFQKIDMLNVTAGGTDHKWFTNLNLLELKILYKTLEDIWNYRSELSSNKKYDIVKTNPMFSIYVKDIYTITNKRKLQYIILSEMDTLISNADNTDDKRTGAYFILTALVEISHQCMEALPWLIQHV
tara:strand:+ start:1174 stop:2136 length:963 start_codon:yes stop_codon:yes gene_type:complete